jgi:enamine deaminase RidA (YjgF/YER057c/UK114 family)
MVDREHIVPIGMEAVYDEIHYSPAVRVDRTIYISGQIGRDEKLQIIADREEQIVQAFENLKKVVEAAGATMGDLVDLTTFHTDMRDLGLFMRVRDRYLTKDYPAWTAIGASALGGAPGLIVEIKAIAVLSG